MFLLGYCGCELRDKTIHDDGNDLSFFFVCVYRKSVDVTGTARDVEEYQPMLAFPRQDCAGGWYSKRGKSETIIASSFLVGACGCVWRGERDEEDGRRLLSL